MPKKGKTYIKPSKDKGDWVSFVEMVLKWAKEDKNNKAKRSKAEQV
jgi:hypothetical protein